MANYSTMNIKLNYRILIFSLLLTISFTLPLKWLMTPKSFLVLGEGIFCEYSKRTTNMVILRLIPT